MENLFRLMLVRPAVSQDPENPSIDLTQDSPYQKSLRTLAAAGSDVRSGARNASTAFVTSNDFIGGPGENPLAGPLATLVEKLDQLEASDALVPNDLRDAVQSAFGRTAAHVAESNGFTASRKNLRDSLVAIKVLQEEHLRPIEELTRQLRTIDVIARAATDPNFPADAVSLRRWRRRTLRLPVTLGFTPILSTRDAEGELLKKRREYVDGRRAGVEEMVAHHMRLQGASRSSARYRPRISRCRRRSRALRRCPQINFDSPACSRRSAPTPPNFVRSTWTR